MSTALEARVLLGCFILALLFHAFAVYGIRIRGLNPPTWHITEILLVPEHLEVKNVPPSDNAEQESSIPSFVSLPEGLLMIDQPSPFKLDNIKLFRPQEDEAFFRDAAKMIAEDAHYFEDQLSSREFLPLDEARPLLDPIGLLTPPQDRVAEVPHWRLQYLGSNPTSQAHRFDFLKGELEKYEGPTKTPLVLWVAFATDHALVRCQIEQSSGDANLDRVVLRLLQGMVLPAPDQQEAYRGRLQVTWTGGAS